MQGLPAGFIVYLDNRIAYRRAAFGFVCSSVMGVSQGLVVCAARYLRYCLQAIAGTVGLVVVGCHYPGLWTGRVG
jgi:hypothetical protein